MNNPKSDVLAITVIGTGAIGSLIAAYSKSKNIKVCQVSRSTSSQTLTVHMEGLTEPPVIPLNNFETWNTVQLTPIVVVPVKAFDVKQTLTLLKPKLKPESHVFITHNGLGTIEMAKDLLGDIANLYFCTTSFGVHRDKNKITLAGRGEFIWSVVSQVSNSESLNKESLNKESLTHKQISQFLPNAKYTQDLLSVLWKKLAVNCCINPITALFDIKNGKVLEPFFADTIRDVVIEICQVALTQGIRLNEDEIITLVYSVATKTAANSSSMRQDILNNRKTEIEYINGYIHTLGQQLNIPTPLNTDLMSQINKLVLL